MFDEASHVFKATVSSVSVLDAVVVVDDSSAFVNLVPLTLAGVVVVVASNCVQ